MTGAMDEVMPAHRFELAPLELYLRRRLPEFGGNLRVRQIQGGASNPTLLVSTDGLNGPHNYVLRKKPPGSLLPSAHRIDREVRIITALEGHGVPVPHVRFYCDDVSVIGTEFYVMDYLEGRIFRDARLPGQSPGDRAKIYDSLSAVLARLHTIDPVAIGLADYGSTGNYFARQMKRWTEQYRSSQDDPVPAMDRLIDRLASLIPDDETIRISHGDYRLENVMFHPTKPEIIAVLDWELSTLGNPLADVGYTCFLWHSRDSRWGSLDGIDRRESGIPSEEDFVAAYCRRTGRDGIDNLGFYIAFAVFRLAAISLGVYRRSLIGNLAADRPIENETPGMAEQALAILDKWN